MATTFGDVRSDRVRDRAFFVAMAVAIAATTVAGFSLNLAAGRSTFGSPWWVHVHAITFMGWLGIYLAQNVLVYRGAIGTHRRFGRFASVYLGWMVSVGIGANVLAAMNHRIPRVFEPNVFLIWDWETVLVFAGLTWAGVAMRARTDWHRRLMLCGALQVMTPGVGRLLPLPFMGTWVIWGVWCVTLVYLGVAATYDVITRGRVHPAYWWGFGTITLASAVIRPIAFTPPVVALAAWLTA